MLVEVNVFVCWKCIEDMGFCMELIELYVKVGLGISRTNVDSQWNPVCNTLAFHRFFCCENETIRR